MRSNRLALRRYSKATGSHEYNSAHKHEINDVRGRGTACRNWTIAYPELTHTELKAAYWYHQHSSEPPHHVNYAVLGVSRMTSPGYIDSIRLSALAK